VDSAQRMHAALERLCKWRLWFAGWQLGTHPGTYGPTRAARDAAEALLLMRAEITAHAGIMLGKGVATEEEMEATAATRLGMRAEVTALTGLLIEKGICTEAELQEAIAREADFLAEALSRRFPGVTATDAGLIFNHRAAETMRREGFPP
jgi:hypothetical protein